MSIDNWGMGVIIELLGDIMSQSSMMNIPKTIRVGYQNRKDTYTGKLAYVIYIDEKGKLRKEASWAGWRDKTIEPNDFPNVPTSGFVLNKKVGDYKSDWNHRMAHIRIYDPRGFEFEIGVENLLYILEECTSTKGKGLEGDFVYAFDGKDLILLPVTSQEYISSRAFTDMKSCKVGKKDMVEGCVYVTKDMKKVMYLGKNEIFENSGDRYYDIKYSHTSCGFKQVFVDLDMMDEKDDEYCRSYSSKYLFLDGFGKIGTKVSDQVASNYPGVFEDFKQSLYGNKANKVKVTSRHLVADGEEFKSLSASWFSLSFICKIGDNIFKKYNASKLRKQTTLGWEDSSDEFSVKEEFTLTVDKDSVTFIRSNISYGSYWGRGEIVKAPNKTLKELLELEIIDISLENEYGKIIKL